MTVAWWGVVFACAVLHVQADHGGGSLRGAVEALQRRQRGRLVLPREILNYGNTDDYSPELAADNDFIASELDENNPDTKDLYKYINNLREIDNYKLIKRQLLEEIAREYKKQSAFRERSRRSGNERLQDLFNAINDIYNNKEDQEMAENDAQYAMLLSQLWSKYKNKKQETNKAEAPSQGVITLYNDKRIEKRVPDNWGPIAFKRKRSPNDEDENVHEDEYMSGNSMTSQNNKDFYDTHSNTLNGDNNLDEDSDEVREEFVIGFQPLEDEPIVGLSKNDQLNIDADDQRYRITKRSNRPIVYAINNERGFNEERNMAKNKKFRSSAGTDAKVLRDLSRIFGDVDNEVLKGPVKRSSNSEDSSHESKPPKISLKEHNSTNDHNNSRVLDDNSHEQHGHNIHHPGISGTEVEHVKEKPITVKKKSIDWSQYFGIDKRKKKSVTNNLTTDKLQKQYFDTLGNEVIYPLNSFRKHGQTKRNYVESKSNEDTDIRQHNIQTDSPKSSDKVEGHKDNDSKLDAIDKKLKNMESLIVDEALRYSNIGQELDSKEEQAVKEKLLSRLAAAYSLEKMRKAMKEFKESIKVQNRDDLNPSFNLQEEKSKRIAIKKEKAEISENDISSEFNNEDKENDHFEEEQGAGHYLNGKTEEKYSEGYMGGSGRHQTPLVTIVGGDGSCPVLGRIVERCRGVDVLTGARGQLFLPLCSLHQLCNLCGETPPTTCDLIFLSEADTSCGRDTACQRAARSTLMALKELHDSLADEFDGECENSPCLQATLKLNTNWKRTLQ